MRVVAAGLLFFCGLNVVTRGDPAVADVAALARPVLRDARAVEERVVLCRRLLADRSGPPSTVVTTLAQWFLWFADPEAPGRLQILDLEQWDSPALRRFLAATDLPCPAGLVFVREYAALAAMPTPIRAAFTRQPSTQAVTFLARYVAVLDDPADGLPDDLRRRRLRQTLEHEWVHVAVNSLLSDPTASLPAWFQEGCAITFSGQRGSQSLGVLTEDGRGLHWVRHQWSLPDSYQEYRCVFRYLRRCLGDRDLGVAIRRVVQAGSPRPLLQASGCADYATLRDRALRWGRRRESLIGLVACLVPAALLIRLMGRPRRPA